MISLTSFSFQYDIAEDRILLLGNLESEAPCISFWLTRRLTMRLISGFQQVLAQLIEPSLETPAEHAPALAEFAQAKAASQMSFQPDPAEPVPQAVELLQRIDLSYRAPRFQLQFFLMDADQPCARSVMALEELQQIIYLLDEGRKRLEWGELPADASGSAPTLQ